jgi:CRP/FNR family transcriptional regulator
MGEGGTVADVRKVRYFATIPDEAAERIAETLVVRAFSAREYILREGDPPSGFYLLREGKGRIFRTGMDGREQSFRLLAAGDTFGEVPVFDGGPNPASVEALEVSEAVLFPTPAVHEVLRRYPDVAMAVLLHLSRRLRLFTEIVEQISLQTVPARIARYLYQLAREEGEPTAEGVRVPRSIPHRDLASLVGSVREVVSRSLKVMEEDGILIVRRHEIIIRDVEALRELA